jgi:hypothetical protein
MSATFQPHKWSKVFGKAACALMICALAALCVRFDWQAVRTENEILMLSRPPAIGLYLAAMSLICGVAWFVLTVGFGAGHSQEEKPEDL